MCKRLEEHFQKYLKEGKVPEYFMKAKMKLISKDGSRHPKIDKTRPISVLPAITKIFELFIRTTMQDKKYSMIIKEDLETTFNPGEHMRSNWHSLGNEKHRKRHSILSILRYEKSIWYSTKRYTDKEANKAKHPPKSSANISKYASYL